MDTPERMCVLLPGLRIDLERDELLTLDGTHVELRPRSFAVLRLLAANAGRVVTKNEILETVWDGVPVTEHALTQSIADIRRAIGDADHTIVRTVHRRGYLLAAKSAPNTEGPTKTQAAYLAKRLVGEVREGVEIAIASFPAGQHVPGAARDQRISFCRTADGVNLAVARVGRGIPLVCSPTWGNHLEYDWESPISAKLYEFLASRFELIRYDGRGFGLSDRNVTEISLATVQHDLEAIIDALDLRRYAFFCSSTGCPAVIAHAASYPERVSRIVTHNSIVQGLNTWWPADAVRLVNGYAAIMGKEWGGVALGLIRAIVAESAPSLSPEQVRWCANLLPLTTSLENALKYFSVFADIDVTDRLPKVRAPTLVLHCRDCRTMPFQQALRIATSIPNARLVSLESANQIPLPGEPAWPVLLGAIETFLSDASAAPL